MQIRHYLFILAAVLSLTSCRQDKVQLYKGGKTNYTIVVAADALPAEKTAASEISKYLEAITGTAPETVTDEQQAPGKYEIIVGKTNREANFQIDRDAAGEEGLIIRWKGKSVFVSGPQKNFGRGTLYAAYEFLRMMGCEFYAKDTETVPSDPNLSVEKKNLMQSSPFENRDIYWSCTFDEVISAKLRLNACLSSIEGRNVSEAYGGMRGYALNKAVHTFNKIISPEEYFAEHPEYFSEINGERTCKHLYSQICMTNPDVLRLTIEKVKEWLRQDPNARIVSVSQNDSFVIDSYCTCEKCRAINEEEGSPAGSMLRFINAVADGIKDEFPDVAIDMLAYQYSIVPPAKTVPRENVIVRYCTGNCYPHPIAECENNANVKSNIQNWNGICNRLYIWDYTTNFAQYLCPIANFYSLKPNLQFFRDNGVKGVFEQGMYQEGESGEFGDLRAYVLAKLMWNPEEDLEKLIDNFMAAYYGNGAQFVREYFDLLHKRVLDSGIHFGPAFGCGDKLKDIFSAEDISHLEEVWQSAADACENGSKEQIHVRRSELSYRWYKRECGLVEFANDFEAASSKLFADCNELGVVKINEGSNIPWVEVH